MKYWDVVLMEVLNKNNSDFPKRFTMIGCVDPCRSDYKGGNKKQDKVRERKLNQVRSRFSDLLKNKLFSWREIECLSCFINNFTAMQTAVLLNLSTRTIEYHTKNICMKFCCDGKKELVEVMKDKQSLCEKLNSFYQEVICAP